MSTARKWLTAIVLLIMLITVLLTWGSIGSAILTLGLLISVGKILLDWFFSTHDPDDYPMGDE